MAILWLGFAPFSLKPAWAEGAEAASPGGDPGWYRIWQNKSWAFQLSGQLGGVLSIALGPAPLNLTRDDGRDPISSWVKKQINNSPGRKAAFQLELNQPGEWALLKARGGPMNQKTDGPGVVAYVFGVELIHIPDPARRLGEMRDGRCHLAMLKGSELAALELSPTSPSAIVEMQAPGAETSGRFYWVISDVVECDGALGDCLWDLSKLWLRK